MLSNNSLFGNSRAYPHRRSYILNRKRNLSAKLKSRGSSSGNSVTNMISLMTLAEKKKSITWDIVPEKEHMESLSRLSDIMALRFTNRANLYLKDQDYQIIDLLLSLKYLILNTEDQALHNKWVTQVRFYHHVSEVGPSGALQLANPKQSSKNIVQRRLVKLFDFW